VCSALVRPGGGGGAGIRVFLLRRVLNICACVFNTSSGEDYSSGLCHRAAFSKTMFPILGPIHSSG
jgi:hypothetical protein